MSWGFDPNTGMMFEIPDAPASNTPYSMVQYSEGGPFEQVANPNYIAPNPWEATPSTFIADPFGGGGTTYEGYTPTGVKADPNNYEFWNNLWLDKTAPMDWSLGLASFGGNMLGKSFQGDLTSLANSLYGKQFDDLAWQKALLGARGYFNQNGMNITPNTSDAYLKQVMLQQLGQQNNLDMTALNNMINSGEWQNYFNTSAQEAGQQNTQYQASVANPMPWPVKLIAAITGGMMGYGALSGMGILGGAAGEGAAGAGMMDMGQWAAMDSMSGLNGLYSGAGTGAGAMDWTSGFDLLDDVIGSDWSQGLTDLFSGASGDAGIDLGGLMDLGGNSVPDWYLKAATEGNWDLGGLLSTIVDNPITSGASNLIKSLLGSNGSNGTSNILRGLFGTGFGTGTNGGFNLNSLFGNQGYQFDPMGMLGAYLQYDSAQDFENKLEQMKNEAMAQSDPFGLNRRDKYEQRLNQSYTDPFNIPELQSALDYMNKQISAKDAMTGRNNQYAARAQDMTQWAMKDWLPEYRKGLIQPSGATFAPQGTEAVTKFAMPLAMNEFTKSNAMGYGLDRLWSGKGGSNNVFGGGQNLMSFLGNLTGLSQGV